MRRLFNLLAALSMVLCVAVMVLWVVSYNITWRHERDVQKKDEGFQLKSKRVVASANGQFSWIDTTLSWKPPTREYVERFPQDTWRLIERPQYELDSTNEVIINFPGIYFQRAANPAPDHFHPDVGTLRLILGYWLLVLVTSLIPLSRLIGWLRRRQMSKPGHCPTCGYDLRATPEKGKALLERCPECGNASAACQRSRNGR